MGESLADYQHPAISLPTAARGALMAPMPELNSPQRQQKIALAEMRSGLFCAFAFRGLSLSGRSARNPVW